MHHNQILIDALEKQLVIERRKDERVGCFSDATALLVKELGRLITDSLSASEPHPDLIDNAVQGLDAVFPPMTDDQIAEIEIAFHSIIGDMGVQGSWPGMDRVAFEAAIKEVLTPEETPTNA